MNSKSIILVTGLLLQAWNSCWAATTIFTDGTFSEVDWEEVLMVRPPPDGAGNGTGSGTAMQEADPDPDGADDTMRQVHVIRDPDVAGADVSTRLFSLARDAVFNPTATGLISSVSVSLSGIQIGAGSGGTVEPALQQGDKFYVAAGQSLPEQVWTLKEFPGLTESDFIEPGLPDSHPDFSNVGEPITFGFAYVVATPSDQTVERTVGLDDWRVTISHSGIGTAFITAGINDAWYEQATDGQGFFITALPEAGIVFLSWFTFDTERPPGDASAELGDPGHRWLTAQGPYAGNTAFLDVYETTGGVFDSALPAPEVSDPIGTIVIVWEDCQHATLDYDLPAHGLMGRIDLVRIAADNVALCEALIAE
jgi:hypothetical protein